MIILYSSRAQPKRSLGCVFGRFAFWFVCCCGCCFVLNGRSKHVGKNIKVDDDGVWIRRTLRWKPQEAPLEDWRKHPEEHQTWREMFPDPRKVPLPNGESGTGAISSKGDDIGDGLAEADILEGNMEIAVDPDGKADYWEEAKDDWILWRVKPTKGFVSPRNYGGGPNYGDLTGFCKTEAKFEDGHMAVFEDWYDVKGNCRKGLDDERRNM